MLKLQFTVSYILYDSSKKEIYNQTLSYFFVRFCVINFEQQKRNNKKIHNFPLFRRQHGNKTTIASLSVYFKTASECKSAVPSVVRDPSINIFVHLRTIRQDLTCKKP